MRNYLLFAHLSAWKPNYNSLLNVDYKALRIIYIPAAVCFPRKKEVSAILVIGYHSFRHATYIQSHANSTCLNLQTYFLQGTIFIPLPPFL